MVGSHPRQAASAIQRRSERIIGFHFPAGRHLRAVCERAVTLFAVRLTHGHAKRPTVVWATSNGRFRWPADPCHRTLRRWSRVSRGGQQIVDDVGADRLSRTRSPAGSSTFIASCWELTNPPSRVVSLRRSSRLCRARRLRGDGPLRVRGDCSRRRRGCRHRHPSTAHHDDDEHNDDAAPCHLRAPLGSAPRLPDSRRLHRCRRARRSLRPQLKPIAFRPIPVQPRNMDSVRW